MRLRWSSRGIRFRLTVWYAGSLLVLLLLYGAGVFAFVWGSLSHEMDQRLREDFEVVETMLDFAPDGELRWLGPLHAHEGEEVDHQIWVEAWSSGGELLFRGEMPDWVAGALPRPQPEGDPIRRLSLSGGPALRYLEGVFAVSGRPLAIRVIRSEARLKHALIRLALIELLALPFAAAIAGLIGYVLARRLLGPVAQMTERARTITADRLNERLPIKEPVDEIGRLAEVFNTVIARLQRSFEGLRQFTSDAAHELRTPLTSIRSVGEVALRESRDEESYRETIASMLEEAERLHRLVDSLLTLNTADDGRVVVNREHLDLSDFAREVVDDLSVLAEEKDQALEVEAPGAVYVDADRHLLRHALVNLLDNAVKYSPDGSIVRVLVHSGNGDAAVLEVVDQGPGIPAAHQARVFERFYRVDKSRSRAQGGSGLGLAIVRWAVRAHGGDVELESSEGRGCVFRVTLPNGAGSTSDAPGPGGR